MCFFAILHLTNPKETTMIFPYIKRQRKRGVPIDDPSREDSPPAERQSGESMEKVALEPGF